MQKEIFFMNNQTKPVWDLAELLEAAK